MTNRLEDLRKKLSDNRTMIDECNRKGGNVTILQYMQKHLMRELERELYEIGKNLE
jgi:hypothetical protein